MIIDSKLYLIKHTENCDFRLFFCNTVEFRIIHSFRSSIPLLFQGFLYYCRVCEAPSKLESKIALAMPVWLNSKLSLRSIPQKERF